MTSPRTVEDVLRMSDDELIAWTSSLMAEHARAWLRALAVWAQQQKGDRS